MAGPTASSPNSCRPSLGFPTRVYDSRKTSAAGHYRRLTYKGPKAGEEGRLDHGCLAAAPPTATAGARPHKAGNDSPGDHKEGETMLCTAILVCFECVDWFLCYWYGYYWLSVADVAVPLV